MATYDYNSDVQAEKNETLKYNARAVSRMKNVAVVPYTFVGGEVATNTVLLFTTPYGCTVHNIGVVGATTATATVDVGAGAVADSIASGLVVATGTFTDGGAVYVEVDKGGDIFASFDAVSPVVDEQIVFVIEYSKNT
jgi:hypothetical protein